MLTTFLAGLRSHTAVPQVLRELSEKLPWGWEPVLSETQHAIYFVNNRGEW